jgi:hypothetical protein
LIDNNDAADAPSAHPETCDTIFVEFVGNWLGLAALMIDQCGD